MKINLLNKFLLVFALLLGFCVISPKPALAVICGGFNNTTVTLANTTCVVDGVMGIDNPNNTETSSVNSATLVLGNSNANPAEPLFITINPGSALSTGVLTIRNDVTISIAEGGQILSGRALYMEDKDADGWPASETVFTSTASGRRRLGLMRSRTDLDCSDNAVNGYNPTNSSGPWYQDTDGDGKGNSGVTTTQFCTPPAGYVADDTDCNDGSNQVSISHAQCYADADGDSFTGGLAANSTCLNNASCNNATRASASTHGAAVTNYTSGRLLNAASAQADCNDSVYNANNNCYLIASGGNISYSGNYKIHTFYGSGTFSVTSLGANNNVEYLVVAGGGGAGGGEGGGSRRPGGGGGAGGYLTGTVSINSTGNYGVTVGAGGIGGGLAGSYATNGGNSVFAGFTAIGGGHGGMGSTSWPEPGAAGGSGGGGGSSGQVGGSGTPGQGYGGFSSAGGGGGAGAASTGKPGGYGVTSAITGGTYSAGGTGGVTTCNSEDGWYHGSSAGSYTGNGGHAGCPGDSQLYKSVNGGSGGSGIVVVRYIYQ